MELFPVPQHRSTTNGASRTTLVDLGAHEMPVVHSHWQRIGEHFVVIVRLLVVKCLLVEHDAVTVSTRSGCLDRCLNLFLGGRRPLHHPRQRSDDSIVPRLERTATAGPEQVRGYLADAIRAAKDPSHEFVRLNGSHRFAPVLTERILVPGVHSCPRRRSSGTDRMLRISQRSTAPRPSRFMI